MTESLHKKGVKLTPTPDPICAPNVCDNNVLVIEGDQTCDTLYCDDPKKGCACDDKYQNIDGKVC